MLAGGFEEGVIPLEHGEPLGGAFAVQGFEELALGVVPLQLRVRSRRKKAEQCGGQEKYEISHADEN